MAAAGRTHYEVLGVANDASAEAIRAAHKKAREKFRALGDGARLRAADTAFVVLSDPALRAQYDRQFGAASASPAPARDTQSSPLQAPYREPFQASHHVPSRDPFQSPRAPSRDPSQTSHRASLQAAEYGSASAMLPPPAAPRQRSLEGEPTGEAPPLSARRQAEAYLRKPRMELAREALQAEDWAGFWRRLLASWVDSVVLYIPSVIVGGIAIALMMLLGLSERTGPVFVVCVFLGAILLYHALFIASGMVATPGRMALGIAVVDAESGEPPATGQAIMRSFLSMAGYFLIIPNLIGLFNRRKQSLADVATNTVVVNYKPTTNALVVAIVLAIGLIAGVGVLAAVAIPAYQDYVQRARILEVRQDLAGYAQALEQQIRANGRVPGSLDNLPYTPRSRIGAYTVKRNGSLTAEFKVGRENGVILLQPSVSKETGAIGWECLSDGLRPPIRPRDCPQMEQ